PAYEDLGFRKSTVIGLEPAAGAQDPNAPMRYRSVVVLSRDAQTNYVQNPEALTEAGGMAATEWALIRDALQRDTSLASVSNFSSQVSRTMQEQAIAAIVLSILAVVVYIWFRFGSLRFGMAAVLALVHDVVLALGLTAAAAFAAETSW